MGLCASHHLKNNPPKGRIPKRWDKNPVQEILPEGRIISRVLLIEGYLHVSTFYNALLLHPPPTSSAHPPPPLHQLQGILTQPCYVHCQTSLGLTSDPLGLVPMPRGTIYIPFIHLSNLSDLPSLVITGNCLFS